MMMMITMINTLCLKKRPTFGAITLTYVNASWYFLAEIVTDKASNQKTLYYATPNNLCFCTAWKTGKHKNRIFSLKCCISTLKKSRTDYLNSNSLFDSQFILTLLYDFLNLVINAFSSGLLGAWFRIKEVESAAAVDCLARTMHVCTNALSSWKKNVICNVFDSVWHLLR